jgi:hypothetical protein
VSSSFPSSPTSLVTRQSLNVPAKVTISQEGGCHSLTTHEAVLREVGRRAIAIVTMNEIGDDLVEYILVQIQEQHRVRM